jgi:capsular exopolysaccharide synthesis family protein
MSRFYEALLRQEQVPVFQGDQEQVVNQAAVTAGSEAFLSGSAAVETLDIPLDEVDLPEPVPKPGPVLVSPASEPVMRFSGFRVVEAKIQPGSPALSFELSEVVAEQYRMLRTHILQLAGRPRCIVMSSPSPGDGKTLTAVNLAAIMAMKSDERVLIVDADMRQCTLARTLGLSATPGLGDVLAGNCELRDAIVALEQLPNLHVLPAGTVMENPAELLELDRWESTIDALRQEFSFVILDTTPAEVVADFRLVVERADGFLLVLRPDHTKRNALDKVLDLPRDKMLGVVLNAYRDFFLWPAAESYNYYSSQKSGWRRLAPWRHSRDQDAALLGAKAARRGGA